MAVLDKVPINWDLARNPFNWAIVFLMIVIAAIAFHVVADYFCQQAASTSTPGE
jgi:hypothetical protein